MLLVLVLVLVLVLAWARMAASGLAGWRVSGLAGWVDFRKGCASGWGVWYSSARALGHSSSGTQALGHSGTLALKHEHSSTRALRHSDTQARPSMLGLRHSGTKEHFRYQL
ncbi:hypothetical protein DACRYDRAFT_106520 [Dacryopinax primogenitus]|uniref:Secreted protein n=1 Tax=Dacryopinax primogenitus (strain DJM 731) TaxID=1858805 RepID=M5GBD4_DACPD|nr:uncharacterized protein DACRYDRAFT_106520 [Dacryopinax primogenitus]EJU03362.1 hypothetical protein DACRYDRAFT_106520 [Dacryopinax primogenitus]